jgi:hypothetical protein
MATVGALLSTVQLYSILRLIMGPFLVMLRKSEISPAYDPGLIDRF